MGQGDDVDREAVRQGAGEEAQDEAEGEDGYGHAGGAAVACGGADARTPVIFLHANAMSSGGVFRIFLVNRV